MTARTRTIRGSKRGVRPRALPFPVFLLTVCAAVTIGATSIRALGGGPGAPGVSGAVAGTAGRLMAFMDYFAGVFTLLSLTAAVVCGLAATDRLVLSPRQRVAMQSVHRATAVAALGFLAVHIAVKVAEVHATPLAALLPFGGGATFAVGLGTLAADLLVLTAATGAVRGRFAGSRRPWLWRLLHSGAYACWPIALAHGLTAGRAAAVWVLWSYGLCVAAVLLALLVRVLSAAGRGSARRHTLRTLHGYRPRTAKGPLVEEPVSLATHGRHSVHAEEPAAAGTAAQAPVPGPVPTHVPVQEPVQVPVGAGGYAPYPGPQPDHSAHGAHPYQPQYRTAAHQAGPAPTGPGQPGPYASGPYPAAPFQPLYREPVHSGSYGYPAPAPAPAPATPDWLDDSGAWATWSALTWDTPPYGTPLFADAQAATGVYQGAWTAAPGGRAPHEHGGGW